MDDGLDRARAWIAKGRNFRGDLNLALCEARADVRHWIDDRMPQRDEGVYWRGTNRRQEHADLLAGVEIRSRNHADGYLEAGLSISESPAYVVMAGYRYGYQVIGDVIGQGSDGEPVLRNARPVSKIMTAREVERREEPRRKKYQALERALAAVLGVDAWVISKIYHC